MWLREEQGCRSYGEEILAQGKSKEKDSQTMWILAGRTVTLALKYCKKEKSE